MRNKYVRKALMCSYTPTEYIAGEETVNESDRAAHGLHALIVNSKFQISLESERRFQSTAFTVF
jgi:hypothetical protein